MTGKVYKNVTNLSAIISYFYKCRPDLRDRLLEEQATMLMDLTSLKILFYVISCGRGFGKTMIAGLVGLFYADEDSTKNLRPINVLIVSSQKALYDNIEIFFRNRPDLVKRLRIKSIKGWIPKDGVEFSDNHSRLIPAMATVHSVEGYRADVIIFDESQDIEESVFLKALGCLRSEYIGKVIIIGTPYTETKGKVGKINWFIELVKDPKNYIKGYKFHLSQYPSNLCNWNPHKLWKSAWGKQRFDAECLGFVTPEKERNYFPSRHITQCCLDIDPIREGGVNSIVEGGLDCGYGNTILSFTEKIGSVKRKILSIDIWERESIEDIAPDIGSIINRINPDIVKIDSKAGINVPKYIDIIKKYTNKPLVSVDSALKEKTINEKGEEILIGVKWHMLGQLGRKLRETQLIIPMRMKNAAKLVDQLIKYNPRRGIKDDMVDSLALSCYEPTEPLNKGEAGGWAITGGHHN